MVSVLCLCFLCRVLFFFSIVQVIGWEECLQNELFCVKWNVKSIPFCDQISVKALERSIMPATESFTDLFISWFSK